MPDPREEHWAKEAAEREPEVEASAEGAFLDQFANGLRQIGVDVDAMVKNAQRRHEDNVGKAKAWFDANDASKAGE